jgi:hypothetical protein
MNGKWWRFAIIGVLLFDLCLLVVGIMPISNAGALAVPWADGLALQNFSFDVCLKPHTMENLTMAAAVLLTVTLL